METVNIKVEMYFQEKLINQEYYLKNRELFNDYPSSEQIENAMQKIKNSNPRRQNYTIKVSEEGIEIKSF